MSDFYANRPLQLFRITHRNGTVQYVKAHQALTNDEDMVKFHGEFDGEWKLVLALAHYEIAEIRNLSVKEPKPLMGADALDWFKKVRSQWRKGVPNA